MKQSDRRDIRREKPWKDGESAQPNRFYINIRETMSYDIQMNGTRSIIAEFAVASILGAGVSLFYLIYPDIATSARLYGVFWFGFFLNCVAILAQSLSLAKHGTRKEPEMTLTGLEVSKLRRLTLLIGIVIVLPFTALAVSLYQTFHRGSEQ